MFGDFSDKDFAQVILSVENYDLGCKNLVDLAKDKGIPLELISSLVNIQRKEYNLYSVSHADYRDILLDEVVSGNKYFFNSENLKLILATIVTLCDDGNSIDIKHICRIAKEVKKFLSFKINFSYEISEYLEELLNFKVR